MTVSLRSWLGAAATVFALTAHNILAQSPRPRSGGRRAPPTAPATSASAQAPDTSATVEIYGFAQGDAIYDFNQNNPNWFDVNRPSRLPAFKNEFGANGHTWISARQSRFGVKATVPTPKGPPFKVTFEYDLFGVGPDQGQFTIRPRHIYGQWGQFGAGQTNSPFMDVDVFPNILEYWGPNGMLFFRNMMVFWQPINKPNGTHATFALERPGASGDAGIYADRVELQNIVPRFPAPDISGDYRYAGNWGYVELGGMLRWINWEDVLSDTLDLSGGVTGWGLALSSNLKAGKNDIFRLIAVYGAGVENYFNDAPVDVGVERQLNNRRTPITGEALPDFGMSAYLDHTWNSHFTSAIGYARVDIDNSDAQAPSAFKSGQYASTNLLWTPVPNILMGGEFQWGHRENNSDGFSVNDFRLQFSFKYSYSQKFGGK